MESRMLGRLWPVSALTLGGGGVGQLWGPTTRDECIATVRTAVDCGITLLDMAPAYGNGEAENVVGAAFDGRLPAGIRMTTKHRLGTPPAREVEGNIVRSLNESLARMRLERVDLFFLHSNIIPDDYDAGAYVDRPATRWTTYVERFIPVCERLVADGRIGAWASPASASPNASWPPSANRPGRPRYNASPIRSTRRVSSNISQGRAVLAKSSLPPSKAVLASLAFALSRVARSPTRSIAGCRRSMASPRTSSGVLDFARSPVSSARLRPRSPIVMRCR